MMKLTSVGLAKAMWFLDIAELNPGGKDIFTHLVPALIKDYKFKTYPTPATEDLSQGMKFANGEFVKNDGTVLSMNLTLYNDGVAADTYASTDDSEEVLKESLARLPELGFAYDPEMIRWKAFLSQLNVRFSKPLRTLNPKLAEFSKSISTAAGGAVFDMAAIEFWPDQTQSRRPVNFSFQRKAGEPLDTDRYWSQAALPTRKHLELLEELESLLS